MAIEFGYAGGLRRVGEGQAGDWSDLWYCGSCGATLRHVDREKHNQFHEALSKLWDMLANGENN